MNVADYVLLRLAQAGVTRFFMVYGGAIGELMDAVTRQSRITHTVCQHEQAAGFAAEGWAKVSGHIGVAMATSGPGGGNLVTCIQNAYYDSVPMIFITGQVSTKFSCQDPKMRQLGFQETPMSQIAAPITKWSVQVSDAGDIVSIMDRAILLATRGRPGPVLLDIPTDVQKADVGEPRMGEGMISYDEFWESPFVISNGIDVVIGAYLANLYEAKRPVLLIGGGCRHSKGKFREMAEKLNIPTVVTWNAMDVCTSDLPYYAGRVGTYGGAGRNFAIQNADLVLAIGCRMSGRITGGMPKTFAPHAKTFAINIDPTPLPVQSDFTLHCDAGTFMTAMSSRLSQRSSSAWSAQCRKWRVRYDPVQPEHFREWHHYGFVRRLSNMLPADAIVVADTGGNVIMLAHCFETKQGQTVFTSNGNTPMGFALCGAIGAWFADPSRPLVVLIGDGGMQLNIQELQTIKHYAIPVKIFVLNNGILGNTKIYQVQNYGGRTIACDEAGGYSAPQFTAVSFAYGIQAEALSEWSRFERVVGAALAHDGPFLVDVVHKDFCDYAPKMVRWDRGIHQMEPDLPKDEYEANMAWSKQ